MFENSSVDINNVCYVASGGVFGTWLRFHLVNYLQLNLLRKKWATCSVNLVAAFLMGLLGSLEAKTVIFNEYSSFMLFFGVGFLGSLSTFSTFVLDFFESISKKRLNEGFSFLTLTIFGGLLLAAAGYAIGYEQISL